MRPPLSYQNQMNTFALSEQAMFILQDLSEEESKIDKSELIHFYKN